MLIKECSRLAIPRRYLIKEVKGELPHAYRLGSRLSVPAAGTVVAFPRRPGDVVHTLGRKRLYSQSDPKTTKIKESLLV